MIKKKTSGILLTILLTGILLGTAGCRSKNTTDTSNDVPVHLQKENNTEQDSTETPEDKTSGVVITRITDSEIVFSTE